jgi:hypothetical protein
MRYGVCGKDSQVVVDQQRAGGQKIRKVAEFGRCINFTSPAAVGGLQICVVSDGSQDMGRTAMVRYENGLIVLHLSQLTKPSREIR